MRILAVETSCDDTAAAVLEDGRLRASVVLSQAARHRPFRGVVPELASRAHLELLLPAVARALRRAGPGRLDAVAYTRGPGLMGPLLVGKVTAQTLARLLGVPAVGVNHLEGHVLAVELEYRPRWPLVCLVASGGHTDLVLARAPGRYQVLGRTRDDAAGEAYDKVARLLGLGYPGGPEIDRLAARGNPRAVAFPRPSAPGWDFSFSGLKTAVLYHVRALPRRPRGRLLADLCASFQEAAAETLADKTLAAARRFGARDVAVGGGVAANSRLRALLAERGAAAGLRVLLPSRALCTDNAAMIGRAAWRRLRAGPPPRAGRADPALPLRSWAPLSSI
ncbi:MAG: tRNA (adenosine(37)-N6)-threonylcarbamoyltransferase complex transferase subunit TsaD [Elusimicrobia bacterium]|nr:tRNA (adenosine(37)-N6)-threonylcarbamoyltransferase complex transferase subunit TsaD [Elusimicrobiota bacterium]